MATDSTLVVEADNFSDRNWPLSLQQQLKEKEEFSSGSPTEFDGRITLANDELDSLLEFLNSLRAWQSTEKPRHRQLRKKIAER